MASLRRRFHRDEILDFKDTGGVECRTSWRKIQPNDLGFPREERMLSRRSFGLALMAVAVLILGVAIFAWAQDQKSELSGTWKWTQQGPGGEMEFTLKLKQDGEKLTGTITGFGGEESPIEEGKAKDGAFSFKVTRDFGGRTFVTNYSGKLSGGTLKAKSETIFSLEFEAKRNP